MAVVAVVLVMMVVVVVFVVVDVVVRIFRSDTEEGEGQSTPGGAVGAAETRVYVWSCRRRQHQSVQPTTIVSLDVTQWRRQYGMCVLGVISRLLFVSPSALPTEKSPLQEQKRLHEGIPVLLTAPTTRKTNPVANRGCCVPQVIAAVTARSVEECVNLYSTPAARKAVVSSTLPSKTQISQFLG